MFRNVNFHFCLGLLVLCITLTGCSLSQKPPDVLPESSSIWDPCASQSSPAFDLNAAASAPMLIEKEDTPTLGTLGVEGTQALADQIQPQGTFCDEEMPEEFQPILKQAQQLADQGNQAGARMLLESLLEIGSQSTGGTLLSLRLQNAQHTRSLIKGYIIAAGLDQTLGGDGQDFIDQANTTFNEMADSELNNASFEEIMRLMEEAQRLGQDDIAQRLLERAREIATEGLDAAIADFDPCLSNPEVLHEEITKLLVALQTAMLLGDVPGTAGPGGARFDAAFSQATAAVKSLMGVTPDECKGYSFNFSRTVSGLVTMTGEAHACAGIRGPWEGTLHLAGTWTDFGNTGEGSGSFSFTLPEDSEEVETFIPTSGQINGEGGCNIPYNDPLQMRVHLIGIKEIELGIVSTNAGTASIVCPEGTTTLPSLMTVWTDEPTFNVEISRYTDCP